MDDGHIMYHMMNRTGQMLIDGAYGKEEKLNANGRSSSEWFILSILYTTHHFVFVICTVQKCQKSEVRIRYCTKKKTRYFMPYPK